MRRSSRSGSTEMFDTSTTLFGRRIMLRPLALSDFDAWREVRTSSADWLLKWEPQRSPNAPDPTTDRDAFAVRCSARHRERQLGAGYGFGIFYSSLPERLLFVIMVILSSLVSLRVGQAIAKGPIGLRVLSAVISVVVVAAVLSAPPFRQLLWW